MTIQASVITVSDEISSGADANRAGPIAVELLAAHGADATLVVVPDSALAIQQAVTGAIESGARVVITSGGTGIGPSDVTTEAVWPLLDFQLPGITEEIRRLGATHAPIALVSREIAGVVLSEPSVFVLTAPGSRGGVRDAITVVGPLLAHILAQLDGAGHI